VNRPLLDLVRGDLRHFGGPSSYAGHGSAARSLLAFGPQALAIYRLGHWLRGSRRWHPARLLAPVHGLLAAYARNACDIHLDPSADIGPRLKIFHFGGIHLRGCKVGEGCVIHQEVRLEPAAPGGEGPVLGDRVWVGPHARIVGPVRVGDGATIAAGAVVMHDVPAGALVVGNPARPAKINYDNARLLGAAP
jgi:serine O-acetyltransferase